jgi:hypothetical protein
LREIRTRRAISSSTKGEWLRQGDVVEVVTVNRANGGAASNRRPKPARNERWRGVVVGPSVMGSGWWMVKKMNGRSAPWMTYTIPEDEVVRVVRRSAR